MHIISQAPIVFSLLLMSLAGCLNVTGHEIARQRGYKLNGMKIKIERVMNPCAFIGYSFEERADFQKIQVTVDANMEGVSAEEKAAWLEETENRCPVTDNVRADTSLSVAIAQ